MRRLLSVCLIGCLCLVLSTAYANPRGMPKSGLNPHAAKELRVANVDKYFRQFKPAFSTDAGGGWTKHTFDPGASFDGPLCIAGTPYSVFTKKRSPSKLLIMLQGGGACWQDFYNCNILAEDQEPPPPPLGIWDDVSGLNPLDDWSVVYMPYCDGSVFTGDNDVLDPAWQAFIEASLGLPAGTGPQVRFHRGLRNVTAGVNVARRMFPRARRIVVAGSSAGGVGATAFAPFLARKAYGNRAELTVFNDAGPVAINLADTGAIAARAADWKFGQFYPASCTQCDDQGQGTALIKWRLANDSTIREAFYSTDFDLTNRFFMKLVPPFVDFEIGGQIYRDLIISEHGEIHDLYPDRYKRFIRANQFSHTALQTFDFYESANGVPLYFWLGQFLADGPGWTDIVE